MISKQIIKDMAGIIIYNRGLRMHKNKMVQFLKVNITEEDNFRIIGFNAIVKSSIRNVSYRIYMRVVENCYTGEVSIGSNCSCPYDGDICKHQVAVLIEFLENKDKYIEDFDKKEILKANDVIKNIKEHFSSNKDISIKKKLNVEYKLIIERGYIDQVSLEMKIGDERLYVVKNMRDFIQNILQNKEIYFGKKFTFNANVYTFEEKDKKVFDILYSTYEMEEMIKRKHNYSTHKLEFFKGKSVFLTDENLKKIMESLIGSNIDLKAGNREYSNIHITEEELPLEFQVEYNEDKIVLHQKTELGFPIVSDGTYFFYNNSIYNISKYKIKSYGVIFNYFISEGKNKIEFSKEDSEDVVSYVLPSLKEIDAKIEVDEKLKNKFIKKPLKTQAYLDKEGKSVVCNIVFKYDNEEINPLGKEKKNKSGEYDKILIRDTKEEENILNIVKSFGFYEKENKFKLKDEEKIWEFVREGIDKLRYFSEIYYSDAFKNMKIYKPSSYKSSVKLNSEDLLEFTFSIDGVDKKELRDIFQSLEGKKKYHRLKNGAFIDLANDEIIETKEIIDNLNISFKDLEKDSVFLSKSNAIYIDSLIDENNINFIEKNEEFKSLIKNIKNISEKQWEIPEKSDGIMRGYQKFGFKWFKTLSSLGFGGILADEMGLGKTLQTIAFIKSESTKEYRKPSIVVCPTSLVYNWEDEINKFEPDLKSVVVSGNKNERKKAMEKIKDVDIVITSYALIKRDIEEYETIKFKYCFIDEAQNIKNPISLNAKSVKSINAKDYFALTGTPIENSLSELWSIFDFIMPGYLLTRGKFSKKYEVPIVKSKDTKALKELNRRIKPFILRRLKKDVIKELPPKIEHNVAVDMTDKQKKVYAAFAEKAKLDMLQKIKNKEFNKSKIQILSMITRLRQICCDPTTCIENYNGGSGKMDALINIINNNLEGNHKMIVFSQFTSVLKNIAKRLKKNDIKYLYLDGSVKSNLRGDLVKDFNEGDSKVFLISLKAGGTGLNLTSADIVIHYDPWWNPSVEEQATDRAHRIGQENTVEVIRLIARGSIEEKINKIQDRKREIIKNVMDENVGNEVSILNMDEEEIKSLFS